MDEIFEHLLQDTDRGISINQIVNRIVFPNHDICMQAKAALERDYGEFCFAAVIPDYEDFQHMDPTDAPMPPWKPAGPTAKRSPTSSGATTRSSTNTTASPRWRLPRLSPR